MKNYLLIESRGVFEAATTPAFFALAQDLAREGGSVEIFLVQNGVMSARAGVKDGALSAAAKRGIAIIADDFSLRERALAPNQLAYGVRTASIATVIDRMAQGWKLVWH
jgi:sulfur relay (sulfurtransferase) complex TusBCD TusD component (DsrE family)